MKKTGERVFFVFLYQCGKWRRPDLARVFARLSAGAHEALVQLEVDAEARLAQTQLAHVARHQGQLDLLQNVLVLAGRT